MELTEPVKSNNIAALIVEALLLCLMGCNLLNFADLRDALFDTVQADDVLIGGYLLLSVVNFGWGPS